MIMLPRIAPNMGTDVALMLGIAHTLMTQGKHDKVFLENTPPGIRSLKSI